MVNAEETSPYLPQSGRQRPPEAEATFCEFYNSSPKLYNDLGNDVLIFV